MDAATFQARLNVSRETMARFLAFEALLRKWQAKINLVGPATLDAFWGRHVADSLQLAELAPHEAKTWLDLGSGAGFPGLVIAFSDQFDGTVYLVESDKRKASFLQAALREVPARVVILNQRIEDVDADEIGPIDVVSARALAPMPKLLDLASGFFHGQTVGLFPKGQNWESELAQASQKWILSHEIHASLTNSDARIIKLTQILPRALENL